MFGIKRLKNQVFKLWCDNEVHKDLIASLRAEVSILKARLDTMAKEAAPAPTRKPQMDVTPETKMMRDMKAGNQIILDCPAKLVSGRLCPIKRKFPRRAYVTKALPGNRTQVKRVK